MSLEDFLRLEVDETDNVYDQMATEIRYHDFKKTTITPPGIRHLSESMTPQEKHLLLWDTLINSTPDYRRAVSSCLRKMISGDSSRSLSPNENYLAPKAKRNQPIKIAFLFDNKHRNDKADVDAFIRMLKDANPWWYVLHVDHLEADLSQACYDTFKELLNPEIPWEEMWAEILPIIGMINIDGKVRLKLLV